MPFGKYRGMPISEVFRPDRLYLSWFCDCVNGNEVLKRAIRAMPGFGPPNSHSKTQQVPKPAQEFDILNLGVNPQLTREQLERLCYEIFHPQVEE